MQGDQHKLVEDGKTLPTSNKYRVTHKHYPSFTILTQKTGQLVKKQTQLKKMINEFTTMMEYYSS